MSPRTPLTSLRKPLALTVRCCWLVFFALIAVDLSGQLPFAMPWIWLPAGLAIAGALVLGRLLRAAQTAKQPTAMEVDPPVMGRWSALNSPADRVPSHGTHQLGQTYAIDIVAEGDADGARPGFRWLWPLARRSSAFPAFGAPVLAVADATVVRVSDGRRDHLSRTSLPALMYMLLVEGTVRSVAGPSRIVGNHVVLDLGDGFHAAYAHLQRGSLVVREGERVAAGQMLARCGNSGNSSEPHLHFQLMDGPDLETADGVPFLWREVGVPGNRETFSVGSEPALPQGE